MQKPKKGKPVKAGKKTGAAGDGVSHAVKKVAKTKLAKSIAAKKKPPAKNAATKNKKTETKATLTLQALGAASVADIESRVITIVSNNGTRSVSYVRTAYESGGGHDTMKKMGLTPKRVSALHTSLTNVSVGVYQGDVITAEDMAEVKTVTHAVKLTQERSNIS